MFSLGLRNSFPTPSTALAAKSLFMVPEKISVACVRVGSSAVQ
jgi:hypothetical protein